VLLLEGSGTGTFSLGAPIVLPIGAAPKALVVADLDGDGALDVAVSNSLLANVSVALGNGDLTFAATVEFPLAAGFQGSAIQAADLNGDGALDLLVSGSTSGDVEILLGDGAGSFGAATSAAVAAGVELTAVLPLDVDRDGDLDLVAVNHTTGQVAVLLGAGNGTFGAAASTAVGADATALAAGDFNRDGKVDLAVTLAGTGQVVVLRGDGTGLFVPTLTASSSGSGAVSIATGDWNRDGRLDLAVANRTSGDVGLISGN
jgi:hypothetical protein